MKGEQPTKLYDRSREKFLLEQSYTRRNFCLISGAPGSGKTSLALSLRDRVEQDGGYFLFGKFNQSQIRSPYPALVSAFTDFSRQVEERGQLNEMRSRIQANIQSEARILVDMIPALQNLAGDQQLGASCSALPGEKALLRVVFVFQAFLLAVASPQRPIVICVDDIQWADQCSLHLISSLIPSTSVGDVFFVATSRDDVGSESHLSKTLRALEAQSMVHIAHITLKNIPQQIVTEMLLDILSLTPQDADELAEYLHSRTSGNLLFLLNLLSCLQDEKILTKGENRHWWLSRGLSTREFGDLQLLVSEKMKELPEKVQEVLNLAAFLQGGLKIDVDLLSRLTKAPVKDCLKLCAERHLLIHVGDSYRWAHDEIEAAAFALANADQVQVTHLAIGRRLWKKMNEEELKLKIFVVLNQIMRAVELITDQMERNAVASLCLWAGKTAVRSSTYRTAQVYLDLGLELLDKDLWRKQYDLSIELHNLTAECAYCAGDFDRAQNLRREVFRNGRCVEDKIRLHVLDVCEFGARGKLSEAIEHCKAVLKELGEEFPKNATKLHVMFAILKCKRKLRGMSNEAILRLPKMSDVQKLAVMQILNVMILNVYHTDEFLTPLIALKMVWLSFDFGLSSISSPAFAFYGVMLCCCGDTELGYSSGQLALQLLQKFKCSEFIPRVYAVVYGFINCWKCEFSAAVSPLQYAHNVGMETGDIEFAEVNAIIVGYTSFNAGESLIQCESRVCLLIEALEARNQECPLTSLRLLQKLLQYLVGKRGLESNKSKGVLLVEEYTSHTLSTSNDEILIPLWEYYHFAFFSYLFGDFERAAKEIRKARPLSSSYLSNVEARMVAMLDGVIHLTPGRHRSTRTAQRCIRTLKRDARKAPHLFLNCQYFVQAELAANMGNSERAISKFMSAASLALESNFRTHLGFIYERFGDFYGRMGKRNESLKYYTKAVDMFREWGAIVKVQNMYNEHPELQL